MLHFKLVLCVIVNLCEASCKKNATGKTFRGLAFYPFMYNKYINIGSIVIGGIRDRGRIYKQ